MSTFRLEIVTPTRVIDEGAVDYVRCPGADGQFGVMAGHTNAMFALSEGEIKVVRGSETTYLATRGGFAEVTATEVKLLVETAEHAGEIDVERAKEALDRARDMLSGKNAPKDHHIDLDRAEASLKRAMTRLRVSRRTQL